jgi:N-methylhydantoinase A
VDAERLNAGLDQLELELRNALRHDGVGEESIEVIRMLDCRYVGQGYELRVVLSNGAFSEPDLDGFHALHEREYGHAFSDPIEIVNARVTAVGRRPTLDELPVTSGSLAEALLGESESQFRVDGALQALPTRFYDRALLPVGDAFAGPAVVFHLDTTTVVPPGWSARADVSGNLIVTKEERR